MELKEQIRGVKADVQNIEYKIDKAITTIKNDMEKHVIVSGNEIENSKRRLSFVEKMVFRTAGAILFAVLSALIASVVIV
jgi:seryl-tRNA synthetase